MADRENVVAMPGFSVPRTQGEPVPELVAICEDLLRRARSGVLRGLGTAEVVADPQTHVEAQVFSLPSPDRYVMVAAVRYLVHTVDEAAWPNFFAARELNAE